MQQRQNTANRLYLFNINHRDFVEGVCDTLPTAVTRKVAIRQYVFLMFMLAFPMIITITVLVAMAGFQIQFLLVVELVTALLTCAYFVLKRYLQDRVLRYQGNIIYGEVIRQEILPGYSSIGTTTITRIFYRFLNADNERVIDCIDLTYIGHRMPDGRKYPDAGTPVAILYANDKNHKIL